MLKMPVSIVISGASAGLGAALARAYANRGIWLGLIGRSQVRLTSIAEDCRAAGATVEILAVDVADFTQMEIGIAEWKRVRPIDLIIVMPAFSTAIIPAAKWNPWPRSSPRSEPTSWG